MATLKEYYLKDQGRSLCIGKDVALRNESGSVLLNIPTRLHLDFESNAMYISFYIPNQTDVACPSRILLNAINDILSWRNDIYVESGMSLVETMMKSSEMVFSGRIFIYSEDHIADGDKEYILQRSAQLGQSIKFREQSYADERNKHEKPLAFISHDSKDKADIAGPLAIQLQKYMCPVWYDDFSLKVGQGLRQQIEKGLKECKKCILILTPNYLTNCGWGKKEFDSVFTRELIKDQNVILPVWHGVSPKDIYEYSPSLADRVALQWNAGVEEVARKLKHAIEADVS